jgi:hypothetical protein
MTVTIKASDLVRVLSNALPFAMRGIDLPQLAGVCIEAQDGVFTATATDRYVFGHARTTCTGSLDGQAILRLADVETLLSLYRPSFKGRGKVSPTISVSAEQKGEHRILRFALDEVETFDVAAELGIGFRTVKAEFPKYVGIFDKTRSKKVGLDRGIALDPTKLAKFARVNHSLSDPMRVYVYGPSSAVIIEFGDYFVGMIMPVRLGDAAHEPKPEHLNPVLPVGHAKPEKAEEVAA